MRSYDVTSAGISAAEDRHRRMRLYFIMMAIRMACVASLIWVRGWWVLLVALGAVFLPYLAVVIANEPDNRAMEKPDGPATPELTTTATDSSAPKIIIIDEEKE